MTPFFIGMLIVDIVMNIFLYRRQEKLKERSDVFAHMMSMSPESFALLSEAFMKRSAFIEGIKQ